MTYPLSSPLPVGAGQAGEPPEFYRVTDDGSYVCDRCRAEDHCWLPDVPCCACFGCDCPVTTPDGAA